jgi:hypothetical protein
MISRLASNLGKGLIAGIAGTTAMTVSSTIEMKLRDRQASDTPAAATAKVLSIEFESEDAKGRFGQLVHWAYGSGWGGVRGVLATFLTPSQADVAHFVTLYGAEQAMLPALDVSPPATEWGAEEVAVDLWHHAVYVAATALAYRWLDRS